MEIIMPVMLAQLRRRPLLSRVQNGDDLKRLGHDSVDHNERRIGDHQLASSGHAAGPPRVRHGLKKLDNLKDSAGDLGSGLRVLFFDVPAKPRKMLDGARRPDYLHRGGDFLGALPQVLSQAVTSSPLTFFPESSSERPARISPSCHS